MFYQSSRGTEELTYVRAMWTCKHLTLMHALQCTAMIILYILLNKNEFPFSEFYFLTIQIVFALCAMRARRSGNLQPETWVSVHNVTQRVPVTPRRSPSSNVHGVRVLMLGLSIEASRAKREERKKARFRDRGGRVTGSTIS